MYWTKTEGVSYVGVQFGGDIYKYTGSFLKIEPSKKSCGLFFANARGRTDKVDVD